MKTDDDNMGALWRDVKAASRDKRASNRESSAQRLKDDGIPFESKNGGAHLIVLGYISLWPGTGLWNDPKAKRSARGINSLLKHLETIT